mgnify:CR=1 FL=1
MPKRSGLVVARTRAEARDWYRSQRTLGKRIAFAPTMGALHEGHASLVRAAVANDDTSVASIFVNPTQFGPNEDFSKYPRDLDGDRAKLASAGCDLVFAPTAAEMFPELVDPAAVEDDAPSCSVAEALERQSLFVNRVLASHALALLFELLGRGSITHAGGFVNLATGNVVPIPLAPVRKDQPAAPEVARTTSPEVDNAAQPAL